MSASEAINKSNEKEIIRMESPNFISRSPKANSNSADSDDKSEVSVVKVETAEGDETVKVVSHRENRLTSIIDQLRCQSKLKGNTQREHFNSTWSNGEGGVGGAAQRCVRDAGASPAQTPTPAPPAPPAHVKCERFSPQESVASRSRSATPSTSSYPGTPPERGSPHAPPLQVPAHPPRNYSDIMRSLAARYNTHPQNDYFHRVNGFGAEARGTGAPAQPDGTRVLIGGIFASCSRQQRIAVYPPSMDMTYTKILAQAMRLGHCARNRRKRVHPSAVADHSPLDLSAGTENAAKRARLSSSPSTRSDSDDRDRVSNDDRNVECLCAEARARISAWSVEDVFHFVNSIDICAEYATNFREQRIDGAGLPLLTEDHLTGMLQMKLGPALKLKAMLNKKLDPCAHCQAASAATNNTTPANATNTAPKLNGTSLKSEPRSNSTSPV